MLVQEFINRNIVSSIKETNCLVNKGICVLLFDVFKHNVEKDRCSQNVLEK